MTEPEAVTADALGALYERHGGEMTGLARRLLAEEGIPPSVAEAEDVVHTVFARALRAPANLREPRAWLYAVLRREIKALARRCAWQRQREERRAADPLRFDAPQVVDFQAQVVSRCVVRRSLGLLPKGQRTAVWATKALGYTQRETAAAMRKRPGTVATHVSRAAVFLRAHLGSFVLAAVTLLWAVALSAPRDGSAMPTGLPMGESGRLVWPLPTGGERSIGWDGSPSLFDLWQHDPLKLVLLVEVFMVCESLARLVARRQTGPRRTRRASADLQTGAQVIFSERGRSSKTLRNIERRSSRPSRRNAPATTIFPGTLDQRPESAPGRKESGEKR